MHGLNCGMLAIERGRARRAQAGAKAPVLADEQWAAPAEHATYHRTFDHIINQISDRHDQQQQGTEHGFTTRQTNGRLAKRRRHPCPLFLADGAVGRAEPTELDSFRQASGSQRARRSLRRPPKHACVRPLTLLSLPRQRAADLRHRSRCPCHGSWPRAPSPRQSGMRRKISRRGGQCSSPKSTHPSAATRRLR